MKIGNVIWSNTQWAVTDFGLQCLGPHKYEIPKDRLTEDILGEPLWSWPEHMAAKGWANIELFNEAWLIALHLHAGEFSPIAAQLPQAACARAVELGRKVQRKDRNCVPGTAVLPCARCGAVFSVGTGTGRRNTARFCSDSCRSAHHYRSRVVGREGIEPST